MRKGNSIFKNKLRGRSKKTKSNALDDLGVKWVDGRQGITYATFDRRLMAATIDIIILVFLSIPLTALLEWLLFGAETSMQSLARVLTENEAMVEEQGAFAILKQSTEFYKVLVVQLSSILLAWGYCVLSWCKFSATFGKYILKIKIERTDGARLSFFYCNLRLLAYIPSVLFVFLGIFWIYFNKQNRGWHDLIASTRVVKYR